MMKSDKIFSAIGLLLLAAALLLTAYNVKTDESAGESAEAVLSELTPVIEEQKAITSDIIEEVQKENETAEETEPDTETDTDTSVVDEETYVPDYVINPEMNMPSNEVDGNSYIGVISIPSQSIDLPVMGGDWSYSKLRTAPCVYSGSVYQDNMIIAGHNYRRHFGKLSNLSIGDKVTFTDMSGNVFSYKVVEVESISGSDVEGMTSGDWDLTLFTCTMDGQRRITIRCERTDS